VLTPYFDTILTLYGHLTDTILSNAQHTLTPPPLPALPAFIDHVSLLSALLGIYVRCTRVIHFAKLKANIYIYISPLSSSRDLTPHHTPSQRGLVHEPAAGLHGRVDQREVRGQLGRSTHSMQQRALHPGTGNQSVILVCTLFAC
jgi:hypothetical protein